MFKEFKKAIQNKLGFLLENSTTLFESEIDGEELWELYLKSFPAGSNPIYRERTENDCSCCRQFVKNYGKIVGIIEGKTVSIWDIDTIEPYQTVANALNEEVSSRSIVNVFYSKFSKLGTDFNFELIGEKSHKWEHFYYELPQSFVNTSSKSIENLQGSVRQTKDVITRSFNELTPSATDTVLELIDEKTLYRGEESKVLLQKFKLAQRKYITSKSKDNLCWELSVKEGRSLAIRNTAIGTLLINLSAGMDLETAIRKYESVVAPQNYKRPKAIFTKSMRKAAENKVTEMGLINSLGRRHSKIEDISMNNVKWASGESKKVMKSAFDLLDGSEKSGKVKYDNIKEVGIDFFIENILPAATKVELLLDNSHQNNLVSLISPVDQDASSLFKWNNGFSWSYNGNFTDSIKESVKARGGKVDGELRFSLSWAEGDSSDNSDLDAHCKLPNGGHIYFSDKHDTSSGGQLDVDITDPTSQRNQNIVENITWGDRRRMPKGDYVFFVRNYALIGSQKGFSAEIEFGGEIYSFHYGNPLRNKEDVHVATVNFDGNKFKITESLPSSVSSKEVWGLNTMKFIPVTTVMHSPNHWDDNKTGNRHYFFMLENCLNPDNPRGFYNEYLTNELSEHKRVFEALGQKMKVEYSDDQLSGVGFSSTMKNSVILKINNKPLKLKFTEDELIFDSSKKSLQISNT